MASLSMSWKADASRLIWRWEDLVESSRCNCGSSVHVAEETRTGRQQSQNQREQPSLFAEAAPTGMALLKLLLQIDEEESGRGRGNMQADEGEHETAQLRQRLQEFLVEAVLAVVESCVQWTAGRAAAVETLCGELRRAAAVSPSSPPPQSEVRQQRQRVEALAEKLRGWWDREEAAEFGWRWCEAHLTLRPAEESAGRRGGPHDVAVVTEWWWRPDVVNSVQRDSARGATAVEARPFFEGVYSAMAGCNASGDSPPEELRAANEFLVALQAESSDLFSRRIAVGRGVLQRVFTMKATSLLHQAHLLCCLTFLKKTGISSHTDEKRKQTKSTGNSGHELLWVSREGFVFAWRNLLSAITAVQVASMHFDASCEELQQEIRWALFGVKDVLKETDKVPSSGYDFLYVHPCVEPSENVWRITHGVGLIATGKILEGSAILQEKPLLFTDFPQDIVTASDMQNMEMSAVTAGALELFRSSGLTFLDDVVASQMVEIIQSRSLFGQVKQPKDMWSALHLLAMMEPVRDSNNNNNNNNSNGAYMEDHFAQDIAGILNCWKEHAVTLCPMEDFRIGPDEDSPREGKALYTLASLLNHSCSPNTLRVFCEGMTTGGTTSSVGAANVLTIVALRDIEPGEEITISYLPSLLLSRDTKREYNKFACRCAFCLSYVALLDGVLCPACFQLIDKEEHDTKKTPPFETRNILSSPRMKNSAKGQMTTCAHLSDCAYAGSGKDKELIENMTKGFKKALENIHRELLDDGGNHSVKEEDTDCMQEDKEIEKEEEKHDDNGDGDEYSRRAQKAMRQLMDLDTLSTGLPATHFCRLRVRMECVATSLNAIMTPRDCARLVQMCEGLLEDLEVLLPQNYPLLTGIRLHYSLARSRHLIATREVSDAATDSHTVGCCGGLREQMEMMRLPFMQDNVIRECVVRSFQEHYVQTGWRFAREANENDILESFLRRYQAELFACGVEDVSHLTMLSLMCDAAENDSMQSW